MNEIVVGISAHQNIPDRMIHTWLWVSGKQASDFVTANCKFQFRFLLVTPRYPIKDDLLHDGEMKAPSFNEMRLMVRFETTKSALVVSADFAVSRYISKGNTDSGG
ncbi:MAG: hypothetical protein K2M42_00285 [Oscillospiraceae bacterium]|nr:hypothetical protein [Oscillospiraceae bacterium]